MYAAYIEVPHYENVLDAASGSLNKKYTGSTQYLVNYDDIKTAVELDLKRKRITGTPEGTQGQILKNGEYQAGTNVVTNPQSGGNNQGMTSNSEDALPNSVANPPTYNWGNVRNTSTNVQSTSNKSTGNNGIMPGANNLPK